MKKETFQKLLQEKIVILDGATGSNLQRRGMPSGVAPEQWIVEHKEVLIGLQKEFIEAGSEIVYAPTFSGNRIKLKEYGLEADVEKLNRALVAISKEAAGQKAYVAGDVTMTGAQLEPMGDLTLKGLIEIYKEQIEFLVSAGVDLLVIETMMSLQETRAAVLAARAVCDLPIMATLSFESNEKTLYGVGAQPAVAVLQGLGIDAVGVNCSCGPDKMIPIVQAMKACATIPIIAKPNAGMPKLDADGTTVYDMDAEEFAGYMKTMIEQGANMIGGCCGTTPNYIRSIVEIAKANKPIPPCENTIDSHRTKPHVTKLHCENSHSDGIHSTKPQNEKVYRKILLATEREVFTFANGQKLKVGEGINFAKNKELVKEYEDDRYDTVLELALDMKEEVDILRIETGNSGVSEKESLLAVLEEISKVARMPCAIASNSVETIEFCLQNFSGISAIALNHSLQEAKTQIKNIAKSYRAPILTIDKEIIYC
ncbi:homocysteine S-methyltransferase family protein [Lachnospiraceae bacterium ZAX-1]